MRLGCFVLYVGLGEKAKNLCSHSHDKAVVSVGRMSCAAHDNCCYQGPWLLCKVGA